MTAARVPRGVQVEARRQRVGFRYEPHRIVPCPRDCGWEGEWQHWTGTDGHNANCPNRDDLVTLPDGGAEG